MSAVTNFGGYGSEREMGYLCQGIQLPINTAGLPAYFTVYLFYHRKILRQALRCNRKNHE